MKKDVEAIRDRAGLRLDRNDPSNTRMVAKDGSVWPTRDTGYRHKWFILHKS